LNQLHPFLKLLKTILWVGFGLILFFIFIEILRAYQTLSSFSPFLGFLFIGGIMGLFGWLGYKVYSVFRAFPKAITYPNPSLFNGSHSQEYLKAKKNYLKKYITELTQNPNLESSIKAELKKSYQFIPNESLDAQCQWLENHGIKPALKHLGEKADLIVRDTVRDTMVAVIMSPFRSFDSFLVIYRNAYMFMALVKLYRHHPGVMQFYKYTKDVLMIVASVNILHFTERLTENIMRNIPVLNRTTDDVLQGMGAGLLTTAVGKATILRCMAYGPWDKNIEKGHYLEASKDFVGHVRGIFIEDVLPSLGSLWADAWKKVKTAFDATINKSPDITNPDENNRSKYREMVKRFSRPFKKS